MKKYKCIDDHDAKEMLTVGKIYEGRVDNTWMTFTDDRGYQKILYANRFEEVVNEIKDDKRKIIGYKAPFEINGMTGKGTIYVQDGSEKNYCPKGRQDNGSEWYLPPQIVETWEPVYEERKEKIIMDVGTPKKQISITRSGQIVILSTTHKTITIDNLANLLKWGTLGGIDMYVTQWWIGCSDGTSVTKEEIELIIQIYDKEFKS